MNELTQTETNLIAIFFGCVLDMSKTACVAIYMCDRIGSDIFVFLPQFVGGIFSNYQLYLEHQIYPISYQYGKYCLTNYSLFCDFQGDHGMLQTDSNILHQSICSDNIMPLGGQKGVALIHTLNK